MADGPLGDGVKKDSNSPSKREEYLELLDRLVDQAFSRYQNRYTQNHERLGWGRLITAAVQVAGGLLKDADVEDLRSRIERLESLTVPHHNEGNRSESLEPQS